MDLVSLDAAIDKAVLSHDTVVYRGVEGQAVALLSTLVPGDTIKSLGYLSVTAKLANATKWGVPLMRIVLKKGCRAVSMSTLTTPGDVLLAREQVMTFDGVGSAGEFKFTVS